MITVSKCNYVQPVGYESIGESFTEQVGYRTIKQQIDAFSLANDNLLRYRYNQRGDADIHDVDVSSFEDITEVVEAQKYLKDKMAFKTEEIKKMKNEENVSAQPIQAES